jgi:hypothetical protein
MLKLAVEGQEFAIIMAKNCPITRANHEEALETLKAALTCVLADIMFIG